MEKPTSSSKKKTSKRSKKKKVETGVVASATIAHKVEPTPTMPADEQVTMSEKQFGHLTVELNKVSPGYILELFDKTTCPAKLAYDVKMLEKHCYELAMKLFYFYDMNDLGFRALVLDTKGLLDKAVKRRVDIYRESGN